MDPTKSSPRPTEQSSPELRLPKLPEEGASISISDEIRKTSMARGLHPLEAVGRLNPALLPGKAPAENIQRNAVPVGSEIRSIFDIGPDVARVNIVGRPLQLVIDGTEKPAVVWTASTNENQHFGPVVTLGQGTERLKSLLPKKN